MTTNQQFIQIQRLTKGVLAISIGFFGLLVASGNMLDFNSNWQFVQHVLAMDSMEPWFSSPVLQARAIANVGLQQAFYIAIICGELTFGLLCSLGGGCILIGTLMHTKANFLLRGKSCFTLGCLIAILVWYTGFAVIGGEYFAMWANKWNGQMKAYAFIGFILLSLMYISQPEYSAE
ncbi:DUF2165 family protein [Chitinimonas sp. BJB300]|uniref:DUF2165 family protein n=1 Tax=Chitinimonas sp. BJB300 TaxID=1559339 RepID=UPI000C0CC665|nr:DUF2165 domain-containing protein [Chitinimonas sp. BJB300]PHV12901.1 hypothetical protein CSQ89_03160 [Chitinimonas sp. BJB300]TSJ88470.1 DUF2165 domain-containing protein [Chitinimonas sp. BJB300]